LGSAKQGPWIEHVTRVHLHVKKNMDETASFSSVFLERTHCAMPLSSLSLLTTTDSTAHNSAGSMVALAGNFVGSSSANLW
jgi:hypothetical protein